MTAVDDIAETPKHLPTVLFVDDEENILSALRRLCRPLGYRVFLANGGGEGLRILESETVDVVVSDMRMPGMDGAQFLETVAARWPGTVRILLTGYADMGSTIAAVNKGHIYQYLSKPWDDSDLRLTLQQALEKRFLEEERDRLLDLTRRQNEELRDLNANLETKVKERTEDLREALSMLEQAHGTLKQNYIAAVKVFSNLIEMRGGLIAGHARRVADLAHKLAMQMGMGEDEVQQVLFAGLLHDIGKLSLPDQLLNHPYETMKTADQTKVRKHPLLGEALLMGLEHMQDVARLIRGHHERYDGQGYPDGKRGEDIPLGARILSVVNDYDALQIGSLLARRFKPDQAMDFLVKNRGQRYDPEVVDAFLAQLGEEGEAYVDDAGVQTSSADLKTGMALARDLVTVDGVLVLAKGHVLDSKLIAKIQSFEQAINDRLEIYVQRMRSD